jgi:hypothetical protein
MIVPTLRVGMPLVTLCVTLWDAERPGLHSHAERGNEQGQRVKVNLLTNAPGNNADAVARWL